MHIRFAEADERFIKSQVSEGFYTNETELVRDAVRRMREANEAKLHTLRGLIGEAEADLAAGRFKTYQTAEALVADIVEEGQKRLKAGN